METKMKNSLLKTIICLLLCAVMILPLAACGGGTVPANNSNTQGNTHSAIPALERSMELKYATGFSVDYYEGGYKLITVKEGPDKYLVIPENADPEVTDRLISGLGGKITRLYQPLSDIYLAATATMSLQPLTSH